MAQNASLAYGKDIACIKDADDLFTDATGLDLLRQDAIHLVTTDDFLGPGGDGRGFDVRNLLGMPVSKLASFQPVLSTVLTDDDRILTADVTLTATTTRGLADVIVAVACTSDLGPFDFTFSVLDLTTSNFEGASE